jgi:hypothetical protein
MSVQLMNTTAESWDGTFSKLGRSAPAQRADESDANYLRRLSRVGRKYVPRGEDIASVNFSELPDNVVPKFAEMMRGAVERNIRRADNMQPGDLRQVLVTDENTGSKIREWVGPQSFVLDQQYGHRPCRKVTRINAPLTQALYQAGR